MHVFRNPENIPFDKKSVVTVGTFDGVHLGHRKIIDKVLEIKKDKNLRSVVVTFDPHPQIVLRNKSRDIKILSTAQEKILTLDSLGIDVLVIINFTKDFICTSADEFYLNYLIGKIGLSEIVIGYDHSFGKNREGNIETLKELSISHHFGYHKVDEYTLNGEIVSSSIIRKLLEEGKVIHAAQLLGSYYTLEGNVIEGDRLGTKIGFPTANIVPSDEYKLIPKPGVYFVSSSIDRELHYGMMNVGCRPTISDGKKMTIEVNFLDFNKDIYNTEIKVNFLKYIRDEKKFSSVEELTGQLNKDKKEINNLINNINSNIKEWD